MQIINEIQNVLIKSSKVLPGLQHKLLVAHLPNSILLHDLPYGLHGLDDLISSNRQANVSLVSIKQPISDPQHIFGPKHVPRPSAHLWHFYGQIKLKSLN